MRKQQQLNARTRASLFAQLAQAERGAIPLPQTIKLISTVVGNPEQKRLELLRSFINTGVALPWAGLRCGLFLPWEARLIEAAQHTGKSALVFSSLSHRHSERARRIAIIKGRLILPLIILILAVFLGPLPALFSGDIDGITYLLITAGPLLLLFVSLYLLSRNWSQLSASGADNTIFRLLLLIPLPFVGAIIRRQQRRDFLNSLALLLQGGVPAIEALQLAAESISHPDLRHRFLTSVAFVESGETVSEALRRCGALENQIAEGLIFSGEVSGNLDGLLLHHVQQLDEHLQSQFATLAEWLPRVVYVLVVAIAVVGY